MNKRVVAAVACLTVLVGCRPIRPPHKTTGPGGATSTQTQTAQNTAVSPGGEFGIKSTATFADPGPFKTVEVKRANGTIEECLQARGDVGKRGGSLTLSTFGSGAKTFNNWAAGDVESNGFGLLMFERLVELDPWTGKYYPRLAKDFKVSPDGKQIVFTLRKGLQWSDGHPLTVDDVIFTFNTIVKHGYGNSSSRDVLSAYGKFPVVEKIDENTVRFTTAVPFAPLLAGIRSVLIAPKHIVEKATNKPIKQFSEFWDVNVKPEAMVVSGPFKLLRYVPSQRVELVRNPNYFMVDKEGTRLPYLDGFVQAIVPEQNTQLMKFYGNELDILDIRSVRGMDVALLKARQGQGNFSMYNLGPDDSTVFMMYNLCRRKNDKGKPFVDPIKQKWFNDVRFRQATNHAIDRERIITNVLKGVGARLYTAESPAAIYVNTDLKPIEVDLDYSAKLLKEAGFVLKAVDVSTQYPNGRLYDGDGHPVEFTLMTNAGNAIRDGICISIKDSLGKLGMKVNYQPVDFNMLIDKTGTSLDWEAIVMGLSGDRIEPNSGANVWKSDGRIHMFDQRIPDDKGTTNVTDARDWEKRIDKLFSDGATVIGFEKRKPYYWEYQQIVYDQQPYIYIESALAITAVRNTIGNYRPTPLGINYTPMGSLHNVEEIYFKTPTGKR